LAKLVTNVKDPMAGFFVFRREILDDVDLNPQGFKIGLEMLVKARHQKVCEVPIVFRDRLYGESKLSTAVAIDYLVHVLRLFFCRQKTLAQFAKFCVVGSIGVFVNLLVYALCLYVARMHYLVAATLSFVFAVTNNFFLNQAWTFRGRFKVTGIVPRYLRFFLVSLFGYAINIFVLYWLVEGWHVQELFSQFIAILIATVGNFLGSKAWVFKK
jgi:dolichol-phosphate mannosyltransferase